MVYILGNERLLRVVLDMFVSGKRQGEVEPYKAANVTVVVGFISMPMNPFHLFLVELTTK